MFERPKPRSIDELDEDPFAIDNVAFCLNTRVLAVAGSSGHVIVYNFKKGDASVDLNVSFHQHYWEMFLLNFQLYFIKISVKVKN